jgi:hypothetical protein
VFHATSLVALETIETQADAKQLHTFDNMHQLKFGRWHDDFGRFRPPVQSGVLGVIKFEEDSRSVCEVLCQDVGLHDWDMVFSQLVEQICQRIVPQVQRPYIQAKHHLCELVRINRGVERESGSVVSGNELAEVIRELPTCEGSLGMNRGYDR